MATLDALPVLAVSVCGLADGGGEGLVAGFSRGVGACVAGTHPSSNSVVKPNSGLADERILDAMVASMRKAGALGIGIAVLLSAGRAGATWSTVAVDPQTGEVGVSIASCVEAPTGTVVLPIAAGVVPGVGAMAAQAAFEEDTRDFVFERLRQGESPEQILAEVVAIDAGAGSRQYGVVTLDLQTATFTGNRALDFAGDVEGTGYTVQGNILVGPSVVTDAAAAFEEPGDCFTTLADRLMAALEAGSNAGGDRRCDASQGGALAAVLIVAAPDDPIDAPTLDLRIPSQDRGDADPIALLRQAYDGWRAEHPPQSRCSAGSSSGGGDDEDSSTGGGDGPDEGSTSTGGDEVPMTTTSTTSAAQTSTTQPAPPPEPASDVDDGDAGSSGEAPSAAGAIGETEVVGGCGCSTPSAVPHAWWGLTALVLLARRRRSAHGSV